MKGRNRDCGLFFQRDDAFAAFTMWVKDEAVYAMLSATKQERSRESKKVLAACNIETHEFDRPICHSISIQLKLMFRTDRRKHFNSIETDVSYRWTKAFQFN